MNGNPFIPQVEQYSATQDIASAFLRDYQMRLQRESQVMGLMKQLDPVQLVHDSHRMDQYNMIKGVEDYVTGLMKQKKGRLSSEDLFDIQYRISEVEKYQNDILTTDGLFQQQHNISMQDPEHYEMDPTKVYNYINDDIAPADNNFLRIIPDDPYEIVNGLKPFNESHYIESPVEYSDDGKYAYTTGTTVWGPEDETANLRARQGIWAGQYVKNKFLREGVRQLFEDPNWDGITGLNDEKRRQYQDESNKLNNANIMSDNVTGVMSNRIKGINDTPYYLWAMDEFPQKIQEKNTKTISEKMPMANWKETKERLAREAAEKAAKDVYNPIVTTGSEAYYISNKNIKGSETNQPIITYDVKKRQSLRPLKVSKNFSLTDESIIIGYSDDLWPAGKDEDAKSYIGFADKVGKLGAYALSKEDNEIFYGVPIYTGKAFTSPKVTVKKGGKEISKKFEINPGEPVPLEVLEEMKRRDSSWEDNNIERKDMAKLVFDFGSKSMTALHPLDDYVEETFGGTGYNTAGQITTPAPNNKVLSATNEEYEDAAKQSGMTVDEYKEYWESQGYKIVINE